MECIKELEGGSKDIECASYDCWSKIEETFEGLDRQTGDGRILPQEGVHDGSCCDDFNFRCV